MNKEACPVCGGNSSTSGELPECAGCGLVFLPERSFILPSYAPGTEKEIYVSAKAALFRAALTYLDSVFPQKDRLLDIGCAGGELLKAAAARGWLAEGVELDSVLAAKALARGFNVHTRPVEEAGLAAGAYSAVTVFEVFSLMEKPAAAAAEFLRLLKPGGVIYIRDFNASFHLTLYRFDKTGIFRLLGARPWVLHDLNFRARTLRLMLQRAGFREIKIRNSRPTSGDPYRTGGALGGFLTGAIKVLYYWLAQAVWFLTFGRVYAGSSLIVTAKK